MDNEDDSDDDAFDIDDAPLDVIVSEVPKYIQHSDYQLNVVEQVLLRMSVCDDDGEFVCLLQLLCAHCPPHPQVTEGIVNLLACVSRELSCHIIDRMSQLCGDTKAEVELVVDAYRDLLRSDRTLVVPILGSLSDLTLSDNMKAGVYNMAYEALSIVSEHDFPAVIRSILQTATSDATVDALDAIRMQTRAATPQTLRLVLEVVCTCVQVNAELGKLLLQSVQRATTSLSIMELMIIIILYSNTATTAYADKVILELVMRGVFDQNAFKQLQPPSMTCVYEQYGDCFARFTQAIMMWVGQCDQSLYQQVYLRHWKDDRTMDEWSDMTMSVMIWARHTIVAICIMLPLYRTEVLKSLTVMFMHDGTALRVCDPWWRRVAVYRGDSQASTVAAQQRVAASVRGAIANDSILLQVHCAPAAVCAEQVLLDLVTHDTSVLESQLSLLEELVHYSDSMTISSYKRIAQVLAIMCTSGMPSCERVLSSLMVFVQKSIFASTAITQYAAIIVLDALLLHHCIADDESSDMALSWLEQLLPRVSSPLSSSLVFGGMMDVLLSTLRIGYMPHTFTTTAVRESIIPLVRELNVIQRVHRSHMPWNAMNTQWQYMLPPLSEQLPQSWSMHRLRGVWRVFIQAANTMSLSLDDIIVNATMGDNDGDIVFDSLYLLSMGVCLPQQLTRHIHQNNTSVAVAAFTHVLTPPPDKIDRKSPDTTPTLEIQKILCLLRCLVLFREAIQSVINHDTHGTAVLASTPSLHAENNALSAAVLLKTIGALQMSARIRAGVNVLLIWAQNVSTKVFDEWRTTCDHIVSILDALSPEPCVLAWAYACEDLHQFHLDDDGDDDYVMEIISIRNELLRILLRYVWTHGERLCPIGHHRNHIDVLFGVNKCNNTVLCGTANTGYTYGGRLVRLLREDLPQLFTLSQKCRVGNDEVWESVLLSFRYHYEYLQLAIINGSTYAMFTDTQYIRDLVVQHTDYNAALGALSVYVAITRMTDDGDNGGDVAMRALRTVYLSQCNITGQLSSLTGIISLVSSFKRDWIRYEDVLDPRLYSVTRSKAATALQEMFPVWSLLRLPQLEPNERKRANAFKRIVYLLYVDAIGYKRVKGPKKRRGRWNHMRSVGNGRNDTTSREHAQLILLALMLSTHDDIPSLSLHIHAMIEEMEVLLRHSGVMHGRSANAITTFSIDVHLRSIIWAVVVIMSQTRMILSPLDVLARDWAFIHYESLIFIAVRLFTVLLCGADMATRTLIFPSPLQTQRDNAWLPFTSSDDISRACQNDITRAFMHVLEVVQHILRDGVDVCRMPYTLWSNSTPGADQCSRGRDPRIPAEKRLFTLAYRLSRAAAQAFSTLKAKCPDMPQIDAALLRRHEFHQYLDSTTHAYGLNIDQDNDDDDDDDSDRGVFRWLVSENELHTVLTNITRIHPVLHHNHATTATTATNDDDPIVPDDIAAFTVYRPNNRPTAAHNTTTTARPP